MHMEAMKDTDPFRKRCRTLEAQGPERKAGAKERPGEEEDMEAIQGPRPIQHKEEMWNIGGPRACKGKQQPKRDQDMNSTSSLEVGNMDVLGSPTRSALPMEEVARL